VLGRLGFAAGTEPAIDHAVRQLHRRRDELINAPQASRRLAQRIGRSLPLISGAGTIGRLAADCWKLQCNVNAKIPAFASALPELAFDEVAGWGQHGDVTRQVFTSVLLRHRYEGAEWAEALERLVPILEESVREVHMVHAAGDGPLAQLLDLAFVGEIVSVERAFQEGLDPGPAPALSALDGH
jgi:glucose/mannose-6-phosphate isomerase